MKHSKQIVAQSRSPRSEQFKEALIRLWRLARAKPVLIISMMSLLSIVIAALLADILATHDPISQDIGHRLMPPGSNHYFGTDGFGRDIFSRVIYGSRISLFVALLAVSISSVSGIFIGTICAYYGGTFDLLIQRLIDVLLGFPFLVLALVMVVALGSSPTSVAIAIGLAQFPQIARLSRASALSIKEEPYIEMAKVTGANSQRILWKHILPNSYPPVLTQIVGYFGAAVVAETALSFLGLGVPPPSPSWGRMLQEGVRQYFEVAPWATIFPGLALSFTVLSTALIGDSLPDILDPRHRLFRKFPTKGATQTLLTEEL
jgi:peptide/nickel transport system permease protein